MHSSPLPGGRVGVQGPAYGQVVRGDASMRSRSPLASVRPGSPASAVWSLRVQMIRSLGLARVPSAMVTARPF
jgi:hypothetical protein